jgi:hypothetical protein
VVEFIEITGNKFKITIIFSPIDKMKTSGSIFIPKKLTIKIWIFLFCASFSFLSAQDTLDYGLNDPQNPKCPCHKYQKIADDEFKRLLASSKNRMGPNSSNIKLHDSNPLLPNTNYHPSDFSNLNLSGNNNVVMKKYHESTKHKHKKRIKLSPGLRRILDVKNWKIWKRLKKLDSCYYWK